mmetsp:Transcript_24640/g.52533  ORF Transcript_24640/g.52533 Transcript_24640/m.52533 type:complete len:178 (-) Transcript_24640:1189-1722(-)
MAEAMVTSTNNCFSVTHSHFDDELRTLSQHGLSVDEALVLLSKEVTVMFDRFFDSAMHSLPFTSASNMVDHTARVIWVLLKSHVTIAEFMANGSKHHPAISAAFIRFLTRQTGSSSMTSKFDALKQLVEDHNTKANPSSAKAGEAKSTAAEVKTALDRHKTYVDNIVKWNSLKTSSK